MLTAEQKAHFDTFGFLILRNVFSPRELKTINAEFEHRAAVASSFEPFDGTKRHNMNMMGDDTPFLASLLEDPRFLETADQIFDGVLGWNVDANRYVRNTFWHHDATGYEWYGVKFAFYLEPVRATTRALRIIPGSHKRPWHDDLDRIPLLNFATIRQDHEKASAASVIEPIPAYVCESDPGDVVAFDTRCFHASVGGSDDRCMCDLVYQNYPKTPQEEVMAIFHAKPYFSEQDNSATPWNPRTHAPTEWLANAGGNSVRRRWIDEWRRFSQMEEAETGYKTVPVEGRIQVVPVE